MTGEAVCVTLFLPPTRVKCGLNVFYELAFCCGEKYLAVINMEDAIVSNQFPHEVSNGGRI